MINKKHECRKVDLNFFNTAKYRIVSEEYLPCSSESLFRCFEDADSWPEWVSVIENVEWTSPQPFGVGTTRSVEMPGGMIAYEEFLAWDAPRRMAFRFNQFSRKFIKAFAEDYQVTDLGNGRCRLAWTVAMDPAGPAALIRPVLKPVLALNLRKIMKDLRKYMENHGE